MGAFLEEAISPIPSFIVLIPAGAAALAQGFSWWYLPVLGLLSGCGRILASLLLYFLADKGEDFLFGRGRKFFGISHKQLEDFGSKIGGERRGWWGLFLLNAVPVLPTSLLSLACGFVKIEIKTFISATLLGTIINAIFYLSIGYAGLAAVSEFRQYDAVFQILALVAAAAAIIWLAFYQKKRLSKKLKKGGK